MLTKNLQFLRKMDGPVLITGHTGFKGTWLTLLLQKLEIPVIGFSLYPDKDSIYLKTEGLGRIVEQFSDINNYSEINGFIKKEKPSAIIHLAAQPLVSESYLHPKLTFETNVLGTVNLLTAAFEQQSVRAIEIVTTDKVYLNNNSGKKFKENDSLGGNDPYSASKVATEAVVAAWRRISENISGPSVFSVRSGNVIGGGDLSMNRLMPDLVRNVFYSSNLKVRNLQSTRPWQYVLDPLFGYLLALDKSLSNRNIGPYNFGPAEGAIKVSKVIEIFYSKFDLPVKYEMQKKFYESELLELDSEKATAELGWKPQINQKDSILLTATWWENVIKHSVNPVKQCLYEVDQFLEKLNNA
jgi:CDP-glucose 4,6-dehydratase